MLSAIGRSTPSISMRIRSAASVAPHQASAEQRDEGAAHAAHAVTRARAVRHSGDASRAAPGAVAPAGSRDGGCGGARSRADCECETRGATLHAAGIEPPLVDDRPPDPVHEHHRRAAGAVSFMHDERCRHRALPVFGQAGVRQIRIPGRGSIREQREEFLGGEAAA